MFFSMHDKGEMASMVYNWEHDEVDACVITDGSRYGTLSIWSMLVVLIANGRLKYWATKNPLCAVC